MAAEEDRGVSTFPQPPALFYKLYTDENVKAGKVPAPPLPVKGTYSMFGNKFDTGDAILRALKEQNIQQLYPDVHDRKIELKKLNRSINVCFLELLDILIVNPASPARTQKIADLSVLFINMHHLINEFRPHQARETLKVIMERQKKQREDLISQIQRDMDDAVSILKECGEFMTQAASTVPHSMKLAQGTSRLPSDGNARVVGGAGDVGDGRGGEMGKSTGNKEVSDSKPKVGGVSDAWKVIETQNAELCNLIDSLIPNT